MSNNEPEISHCPFCGYPWPKVEGDKFKCLGDGRLFQVVSSAGTLPSTVSSKPTEPIVRPTIHGTAPGIILEVPPESLPDNPKVSKGKKPEPPVKTESDR